MTTMLNGPADHGHKILTLEGAYRQTLHVYEDGWFELTLDVDVAESGTPLTIVARDGSLVDVITA